MSIFQKDCPQCAASNPVHAVRCRCGYYFDPQRAVDTDGLALIAQEERLYRDYLAARVRQAVQELETARAAAAVDPGSKAKAAEVLLAEQRLNAARAELAAQDLRARTTAARVRTARAPAGKTRDTAGATVRPATAARTHEAKPAVRQGKRESPPAQPKEKEKPAPRTRTGAALRPPPAKTAAETPVRSTGRGRTTHSVDVAAATRANTAAKSTPPWPSAAHPGAELSSRNTSVENAHLPSASHRSPAARETATPSTAAPRAFVARQSAHARKILADAAHNATKECPNCTAAVAVQVKRCRCGFEFPNGECQIPPLILSAEERAAIVQVLSGFRRKP